MLSSGFGTCVQVPMPGAADSGDALGGDSATVEDVPEDAVQSDGTPRRRGARSDSKSAIDMSLDPVAGIT